MCNQDFGQGQEQVGMFNTAREGKDVQMRAAVMQAIWEHLIQPLQDVLELITELC